MEKNFFSGHYSTDNRDVLDRTVVCAGLYTCDFINNVHPFNNFSEDRVLCIKEVISDKVDEELAPSGIGAGICHGDRSTVIPVVVCEFILDHVTGPTPACAGRVPTLDHKTIDDPVEDYTVVITFFHERFKVACCNGHGRVERYGDVAHVRLEFNQFL